MEAAIRELFKVFKVYAGQEGSSNTLSRAEFHKLVTSELPNLVENTDASAIDQLMKSLDENSDGQLNLRILGQKQLKKKPRFTHKMEDAIKTLVMTFIKSSKGKDNLDSSSFKKLVSKQLGGIMEDANSSSAIKEMQKGLDENSDGKVSFQEYFTLIGYVAKTMSQKQSGSAETAS
uniref:EF-hand domain-containing protein n=1 Tax=Knipowitschia caucasica TaxID=637954 RepID=A0AAV2MCV5_KNICA